MSLTLELPPPLADEFDHKPLAPADHATLILHLATSLLKDKPETRFQGAVKEFLSSRSLDADKIAAVLGELIEVCAGIGDEANAATAEKGERFKTFRITLHGWRDAVVQRLDREPSITEDHDLVIAELPLLSQMTQQVGRRPRVSALGKYADVPISSEAFALQKQEEIEREERRWR